MDPYHHPHQPPLLGSAAGLGSAAAAQCGGDLLPQPDVCLNFLHQAGFPTSSLTELHLKETFSSSPVGAASSFS